MYTLCGIAGDLSQHGNHRTAHHMVATIDRLAVANCFDQRLLLGIVRIVMLAAESPVRFALDAACRQIALSLGPHHNIPGVAVATGLGSKR